MKRTSQKKYSRKKAARIFCILLCIIFIAVSVILACGIKNANAEGITKEQAKEMMIQEQSKEPSVQKTKADCYINCVTSPYVFFSTPEVEKANIPSMKENEETLYEDNDGEEDPELINNLQLEILGEDLEPLTVVSGKDGCVYLLTKDGNPLVPDGTPENGTNIIESGMKFGFQPKLDDASDIDPGRLLGYTAWILDEQEDGTFLIRNADSPELVMTVDDQYGTQYANIALWEESGLETQRFRIIQEEPHIENTLEEGTYCIQSALSDWMVLSIGDGIYNDERDIYVWESDQGDGQIFTVEYDDYGFAIIHHNDSSKVLTVRNNVAKNGQAIGQYEYDGDAWQRWIIEPGEEGGYHLRSALNVGEVMDVTDSGTYNGCPIRLQWHNESAAQRWYFHTDPVPGPPYEGLMNSYAQDYGSATGYLIMVDRSSNHLGVFEGSYGNWSEVFYWNCVTGKASTPTPAGEFTINFKQYSFDGNMDSPAWYTCYYCSSFAGGYYIHSIIYYQGTWNLMDGTMGRNASHGCIRLYTENAEWIYNNIPNGTKVVIY